MLLGSIATVTVFALGGQVLSLAIQMVITAWFGAGTAMDAFFAANLAPQYIISIIIASLSFVFIPVFVEYAASGREAEARQVAGGVMAWCLLGLGVLAGLGMAFARPLLALVTPGLPPESMDLAVRLALITWPTIIITGLVTLLTGMYQSQGRFGWPAAAPVLGGLVNLVLLPVLAPWWGLVGVALASAANLAVQGLLLWPIAAAWGWRSWRAGLKHPGVRQVAQLLWPLVLASIFTRWTPLIDGYLASRLGAGALAHLSYAFKLTALSATLLSVGISTVLFPRLASDTAGTDPAAVRRTISWGLRGVWLATAPCLCLGLILAQPLITVLFQRGQFSPDDAQAVAWLFQLYLLAVAAMCLGNITGRLLYAWKCTRLLAVMGIVESVGYVLYTPFLAGIWGVSGVALSYGLYYGLSLLWALGFIWHRTGRAGGRTVVVSFLKTTGAALLGGGITWLLAGLFPNSWLQLLVGGAAGLLGYLGFLLLFRSPEAWALLELAPAGRKQGRE